MNKPQSETIILDVEEKLALARYAIDQGDLENALIKLKSILIAGHAPQQAKSMAARLYAQMGLLEKAQQLFTLAAEDAEYSELDTFQLGMTYFDQGRKDEAMHYWDQVLARNPQYAPALYYKALVLTQSKQHQQASFVLENLLKKVAADNFYFERAKDLLRTVNTIAPAVKGQAYAQEHNVEH